MLLKVCLLAGLGFAGARAQNALFSTGISPIAQTPFFRGGVLLGRDGAAFGPGFMLEINPRWRLIRGFGFYGFAGDSSVTNYNAGGGVKADFSDRTFGFGIEYRVLTVGSRFTIGSFWQAAYYGSKIKASYFDPGFDGTVQYRASDREPLVTIGPQVEISLLKGITAIIRPGKDFGNSFAAKTAGGFSITCGVEADLVKIVKSCARSAKSHFADR